MDGDGASGFPTDAAAAELLSGALRLLDPPRASPLDPPELAVAGLCASPPKPVGTELIGCEGLPLAVAGRGLASPDPSDAPAERADCTLAGVAMSGVAGSCRRASRRVREESNPIREASGSGRGERLDE
mmetsp:Transcript_18757/g.43791  ORF Transcript_18757/g.43791 Transcript_18757/m.43791 type:complete len:129 (+) Transcript_18757:99-485(+)